jgi:hypothetical protein
MSKRSTNPQRGGVRRGQRAAAVLESRMSWEAAGSSVAMDRGYIPHDLALDFALLALGAGHRLGGQLQHPLDERLACPGQQIVELAHSASNCANGINASP